MDISNLFWIDVKNTAASINCEFKRGEVL